MQWESLGFKSNPLNTDPITQSTLTLYTGHEHEAKTCANVLRERNVNLVVEGRRGVGTTSFANYLRFQAQEDRLYFTPRNEIRVERGWTLDILLAVVIANIIREIELFQPDKIIKSIIENKTFIAAKAISTRISETYRSFGLEAFGFGVNYGGDGASTYPSIVPSPVLGHHLEDLIELIYKAGYKYGILVQLNNLDVGTIHDEIALKHLFNALRDYVQTDGISWIFVGDIGLRRFIAQEVDRLDDIISYEVEINPLSEKEYETLIQKRVVYYRDSKRSDLPIDDAVFLYLYKITKGRLRYIFGLLNRLIHTLHIGDLTDRITLDIAKPTLKELAQERVKRNHLTPTEEEILKIVVLFPEVSVTSIAEKVGKSLQAVSKLLAGLLKYKLVIVRKHGKHRYYSAVLDAVIAYGDE